MSARRPRRVPRPASQTSPDGSPVRPPGPPPAPRAIGERPAETFAQAIARARRQRAARLRSLWQLTPAQRVAAMRRGELTLEQLAAWSARHPEQVPRVNGEFEWITAQTPEANE